MSLQTLLNAALPHPKATLDQLIVQARRDFVRLHHGLAWRHPVYGYVARSDTMKTYWAHAAQNPSPDNQLRTPNGAPRFFRSVDGAIAALVRHNVEKIR